MNDDGGGDSGGVDGDVTGSSMDRNRFELINFTYRNQLHANKWFGQYYQRFIFH